MIVTIVVLSVLLLAFIVYRWASGRRYELVSEETPTETGLSHKGRFREKNVTITFAHLAGWLIKKNGRDPQNRIRFATDYFKENFKDDAYNLENELSSALKYSIHIRSAANAVNRNMRAAADRKQLIDFLLDLAFVDGDINQREFVALARFGDLIGVQMKYLEKAITTRRLQFSGSSSISDLLSNTPYKRRRALEVLGLDETATDSEIRKTYRKLAKTFHPDKFMTASEEDREKAGATFREIQAAYEELIP
jgi:DnaJ like chaperone protein